MSQEDTTKKLFTTKKPLKLKKRIQTQRTPDDGTWKVLIVDDEESIHTVTHLALDEFAFQGRDIEFIDAYSATEAKEKLKKHPDIALVLLDVVMESTHAGLELARFIREELGNPFIRIILRTGQPGEAPERDVIHTYEINDYKTKTELTEDKLFTVVLASIRTYEAMMTVESYRRDLDQKVKERTKELEAQKAELQEANATKDKFFSIIAHDLKNPFSAVLGTSDLLFNSFEKFDKQQVRELIGDMHQSAKQTFSLLENLLDWSRSKTGRLPYNPFMVDIKYAINSALLVLMTNAAEKEINFTIEIEDNVLVYADEDLLTTVVRNLVSNAIKFSRRESEIKLEVEIDEDFVTVAVIDHGVGIRPENMSKLFRLDIHHTSMGTSHEKGTGLGLILCKEFVEKNGGQIWIESEIDKGSTFFFTIPIKAPSNDEKEEE